MNKKRLTIGYIAFHEYEDSIAVDMLESINQAAKDFDIDLIHLSGGLCYTTKGKFGISPEIHSQFLNDPHLINKNNFDGLILWGPSLTSFLPSSEISVIFKLFKDIPVVNIAHVKDGISSVLIDNYTGIKLVLKHLIEHHGFKKIAFIQGKPGHHYSKARLEAYYDVLKKYKIPINPDFIPPGIDWHPACGFKAGEYFFNEKKLKPKTDLEAIVSASDILLVGLMDFMQQNNISVPHDIALTGFNNKTESRAMVPALTTVEPFFKKLGYLAFEKLYDLIQGDKKVEPIHYAPVDLIIRQSCGCFNQLLYNSQIVKKSAISITRKSGIDNINKLKEGIFNNLIVELKKFDYDFNTIELKKIFLMLIGDLFNTDSKEFTRYFEEYISLKNTISSDLYFLNDVLSLIRKFIVPHLNRSLHLKRCDDLLQQARVMINLSMTCGVEALEYDYSQKHYELVSLSYQLNSAFDIKKLSESLKSILQNLEIDGCYILITPEEKRKVKKEKQVFHFEKGKSFHTRIDTTHTHTILDSIPPSDIRISLVIKPLIFQETKLGVIAFSTRSDIDISLLETLRGTISVALQGAIIMDERKRIQEERDHLYKEAVRANRAKSEFLANMSHEIRTPLNAVIGLNYLMETTSLNDIQKEYANKITYSAQLLLNHINDLLDFSKIEAGKLTFDVAPFTLSDSLKNAITIMKVKSQEQGLQLTLTLAEDIPDSLFGDRFRLEQVLINLISNAIKFTKKGSITLLVSLASRSETSAEIKFAVKDTGIGLSEEQQKKLFKPFVQADTSITRKSGGTGLGLTICRSIVTLLGGDISFESEIDKGSTFFFTLNFKINKDIHPQVHKADAFDGKDIELTEDSIDFKDKNILIVEDNKINQLVAKEILNRLNANTIIVDNGQEAVDLLSDDQNSIHLILMDLHMPVLDGFSAASKIRELPGYTKIPIIALTADVIPESRSRIFDVGMNDYLLKPFSPETLYRKVSQWTDIKSKKLEIKKSSDFDLSILSSVINIEDGLHYCSNNAALYSKLLLKFCDTHEHFIETFSDTIKKTDTLTATKQIHTLKGTSGTLGMKKLKKAAEDIEEEIKREKRTESLTALPLKLKNNLLPVLHALSEYRKKINTIKD